MTDAGLKELAALKNLTIARTCPDTQVTDAGLKELAALTNLTALYLNDTKATDEGVKELQKAYQSARSSSDSATLAGHRGRTRRRS